MEKEEKIKMKILIERLRKFSNFCGLFECLPKCFRTENKKIKC